MDHRTGSLPLSAKFPDILLQLLSNTKVEQERVGQDGIGDRKRKSDGDLANTWVATFGEQVSDQRGLLKLRNYAISLYLEVLFDISFSFNTYQGLILFIFRKKAFCFT